MQMVDHTYSHTSQQEHEACGALPVFYLAFHQIEPQLFQYDLLAQILSDLSVQSSWTACPTTDRPCHARQEHATLSEYQMPLNLQCLQTWPYVKIDSKMSAYTKANNGWENTPDLFTPAKPIATTNILHSVTFTKKITRVHQTSTSWNWTAFLPIHRAGQN